MRREEAAMTSRAAAFMLVAAAVAAASAARADPPASDVGVPRLPVPQAQRPVTLPRLVVATQYRGPEVGARYRFVRGSVEIAGALSGQVFTVPGLSGGAVIPSVPIRFHASESVRFDVVPTVSFWIATWAFTATQWTPSSANAVRVAVPLSARANLTPAFDVGMNTGLTVYDVSHAADTTGIPLGAFLGYVVAGPSGPVLDVDPYVTLPYLIMPWRSSATNTDQYVVGVNVTGYVYL
jgi:hypothetical protein